MISAGSSVSNGGGGGAQNLQQVLAVGNDGGGQNITDVLQLLDGASILTVNIAGRQLCDLSGIETIDFENCGLLSGGQGAFNWKNRVLFDSIGNETVSWFNVEKFTIKAGSRIASEDNTPAPATTVGATLATAYGTPNGKWLADPADWMPVVVNGVARKVPVY